MRLFAGVLCTLAAGLASAHGLNPTRFEAPSGSPLVALKLNAINASPYTEVYSIECFKGSFATPYPCNHFPQALMMRPNSVRSLKVQIETNGDGLYLACTRQEPRYAEQSTVTRICAVIGVGVSASKKPNNGR